MPRAATFWSLFNTVLNASKAATPNLYRRLTVHATRSAESLLLPTLGLCIGLLISSPSPASSLYCEHGKQLATISSSGELDQGSLGRLHSAYRRGEKIRLGWELDFNGDNTADITHWADGLFLTEYKNRLFAQLPTIERQRPVDDSGLIEFADAAQRWSGLLGTDGTLVGRFSDGAPKRSSVRSIWCLADDSKACEHRWRLVYKHDRDGTPLLGKKEKLFDAVRLGRPIRLNWGLQSSRNPSITVEHVAEPVFVTITGNELAAQLPEHIAQESYANAAKARFQDPAVLWRGLMSTSGTFDAVWVNRSSGEVVRRSPQRASIGWYTFGPDSLCEVDQAPSLAVPGGVVRDSQAQ
ncbi:MAG: hypothetical protein AAF749_05725 [Pseudomonadota bacterium]